jgi:hypothetical protein
MTEQKRFIELELGLALSKAEGNLNFLANAEMKTFTQGEAVLDALHAIQEARKQLQVILHKQRKNETK